MMTFSPLTINDQALVARYFERFPPEISEFTFTNLFVWRNSRPIWYVEAQDSLFFFIKGSPVEQAKWILFGPPVGPASALDGVKLLADDLMGLVRLPQASLAGLAEAGLANEFDRDNSDYLYHASDLAELAGRRYAKKRNHVKQCLKKYHCEYEPITAVNLDECRTMLDHWCNDRSCGTDPGLCGEYVAIREMFDHYQQLALLGGAIRVDGQIKAFTIGEQLNHTTAVCHFEKAMPEIQGLAQVINQWFAMYSLRHFEFINREQDLGIDGLRQSKESYNPHRLVEKFNVPVNGPLVHLPLAAKGCPGLC